MGLHLGIDATHKYPMVQHIEFACHRAVPVRHGGHDYAANIAQGHCPIQSGRMRRRCPRGIRMETGAWRCVSATAQRHAVVRFVGLWRSSILHDIGYAGVCMPWFLVARKSWRFDDLRYGIVRVAGHPGWLCFGTNLQELRRHQMEEQCVVDIDALPRVGGRRKIDCAEEFATQNFHCLTFQNRFRIVLRHEFGVVEQGKLWRRSIQHSDRLTCIVVLCVGAIDLYRSLLWIQKTGKWTDYPPRPTTQCRHARAFCH